MYITFVLGFYVITIYKMLESWALGTTIASVLHSFGQVFLKATSNDPMVVLAYFSITSGSLSAIWLAYMYLIAKSGAKRTEAFDVPMPAIYAGIFFFFGNLWWIYSLQNAPSVSAARMMMTGIEVVVLAILGYYLFKQQLNWVSLVGIALIFAGVYLLNKGE